MTPPKSSGTIPRSTPRSRPRTRSQGTPAASRDIPRASIAGPSSATTQQTADQPSLTNRSGNENVQEIVDKTCKESTTPVVNKVNALEAAIPRTNEVLDSILGHLSAMKVVPNATCEQPRPSVDDVNLLRGDVNDLLESRTELTRSINRIEQALENALANQRNQPAPEAVPEESQRRQAMLDALRVDSEEDPQVANEPVHMVRSQSASSRNNSVIEDRQKNRSRNSRSNAKPRSSRQHSRASPMSGVRNARHEDST